jgi:formate dehydrogenase major subunit
MAGRYRSLGEQSVGNRPRQGEQPTQSGKDAKELPAGPPFDALVRGLLQPAPQRDATLQNPRCVFQIVKRHFSRYTPEMVERATGCPRDTFLRVAETVLANSGAERTTSFAYAVAWTQHTNGPQVIGCCALLQLLLGNIGRPGAGIMALRGHASIQGSTDIPTLYHSIHGYMSHPSALKKHDSLKEFIAAEARPRGYWANLPKFMISYLKSMYWRCRQRGKRLRLRMAPQDYRRSFAYGDVRGDERRQGQRHAVDRPKSGDFNQRQTGTRRHAQA